MGKVFYSHFTDEEIKTGELHCNEHVVKNHRTLKAPLSCKEFNPCSLNIGYPVYP